MKLLELLKSRFIGPHLHYSDTTCKKSNTEKFCENVPCGACLSVTRGNQLTC